MYNEIIDKISEKSGMNEDELKVKIEEKKKEFSNLISDEGAAHIVAKEMGIKIEKKREPLYISNLVPGIQNLDITAKIIRIFPTREFNTAKASGKVANIIIGDNTGSIRMTLWNDEILSLDNLKEGDVIKVNCITKEGYQDSTELSLGRNGNIEISDEEIEVKEESNEPERIMLKDIRNNQNVEIRACILKIFDSLFYYSCSQCGAKLKKDNPICEGHKEAAPDYGIFISCIIDDGTESIRSVIFNEQAEKILDMKKEEAKKLFDQEKNLKNILDNIETGKDMIFRGKIKNDSYFNQLQLVVNNIEEIDIKKEIESLQ